MECEPVTICFPSDLLKKAISFKDSSESYNDLVVEAVEQEVR